LVLRVSRLLLSRARQMGPDGADVGLYSPAVTLHYSLCPAR